MKTFELKGEVRTDLGKKSSKAARVGESVPCVLYGGAENVHFTSTASDLRKLIYSPDVFVVELEVAGKKCNADCRYYRVAVESYRRKRGSLYL